MSVKFSNADNIIYHYIQKILLSVPNAPITPFTKSLIDNLIMDLGIWLDPSIYENIPVLVPFVIRNAQCRKINPATGKHTWGCADSQGYMQDDNSIIKAIPSSLSIKSPYNLFNGTKRGTGYVCCHVWSSILTKNPTTVSGYSGASNFTSPRFPETNSFVPNLVWLPKQIASLTDRPRSYAQQLIQRISYEIYRNLHLSSSCKINITGIWDMLPCPNIPLPQNFTLKNLNYFIPDDKWIPRRKGTLTKEINSIVSVLNGIQSTTKIKSSSYTSTLPIQVRTMTTANKQRLINWLTSNL